MESDQSLLAPQHRVLSTLEQDGSRRWMHPRLAHGRFLSRRRIVAYLLLALYVLIPFGKINGKPVILLDLAHRRFTFLGMTFLPTDTALLALLLLSAVLSIFFVTALLGRVWCGWACPQTVYMEFVFRPIERLLLGRAGRGGKPSENVAAWRKILMYAAFFVICLHLANTFLAYFIAPATLHTWITSSPAAHPAGFAIVVIVTALMMFDFCFFREQTCIIACPYGRLQSVLLDKWSLIISYDAKRGEPRGKLGKGMQSSGEKSNSGDCVDCDMCVAVCPTGIDIREGLQVECIGCAQCIDACDTVMEKVKRPPGLIRYSSQSVMAGEPKKILRPRVIIYSVIVLGILGVLSYLIATRASTDVAVLRNIGRPFVVSNDGIVENSMRVILTNRSDRPQTYQIALVDLPGGSLIVENNAIAVGAGETVTQPVRILAPAPLFVPALGHLDVKLRVTSSDGSIFSRSSRLLGPMGAPVTQPAGGNP